MKRINKTDLDRVKQIDLLTYLSNYFPDELTKGYRGEFRLASNHSVVLSNGMWHDFGSYRTGGKSALDYLIKMEGKDFLEAAFEILDHINKKAPEKVVQKGKNKYRNSFYLPPKNKDDDTVVDYLVRKRRIDRGLVEYCLSQGLLYEDRYHNAVFLGYDERNILRYAFKRSTDSNIKMEVAGSQKENGFKIIKEDASTVHVFEAAIDLLSFMTLEKMKHHEVNDSYIALGGTSPMALEKYLNQHDTNTIALHLDNDEAGREGTRQIADLFKDKYDIVDQPSTNGKDFNEELTRMNKYKIQITETLQREVEVDASSKTEALRMIKQQYRDEDIVLTADDHVDTHFALMHDQRNRNQGER